MAMSIRASLQSVIGFRQICNFSLSFPPPLTRPEYRMGRGNLVLVLSRRRVKDRVSTGGSGFRAEFREKTSLPEGYVGAPRRSMGWW
jgi:hypothetical protein